MYFRKITAFMLSIFTVFLCAFSSGNKTTAVSTSASAAILYCADSGEILYEKNPHEKRAIASITKIMTAIIALEYAAVNNKEVKFTSEMSAIGSSMYLKEGEILTLTELTKGMMMVSGNDAANAVAISVAGSTEKFAELMNQKAQQIGMKDTHFVTPSGLDDENHYSTAYDMALLCSYAMDNEQFRNIVSQKSIKVSYIYPENKTQICTNHNRLLSIYDDCVGIKTGFTEKAGRTLTSAAERDGIRLIAVTLNDGNDWNDHSALYDYGFSLVERVQLSTKYKSIDVALVGAEQNSVTVVPYSQAEATVMKNDISKIEEKIYLPRFVYAPVKKGSTVGKIVYTLNGKVISETKLIASSDVQAQTAEKHWYDFLKLRLF
ncbi:MAG: D-alanyl-D-alanine carboxypeptidase family protein [Acutalibacteraceae bacterium]